MKEHVGLVVLEHLRDELDVHVLDVDVLVPSEVRHTSQVPAAHRRWEFYLKTLVHNHHGFVQFLLQTVVSYRSGRVNEFVVMLRGIPRW